MDTIASEIGAPVTVRCTANERCPRPVRHQGHRCCSYGGLVFGPAVLFQLTPGIDCMIALVVGLLGGMLAGMALTRARISDEPSEPSTQHSRHSRVPTRPIGPADSAERAFSDDDPALTDEERIVRLLASNGGRMKQSQIVDRTDWSKAKVSRLLSSMEDGEEITKLTVGRENIIFLGSMDGVYASDDGPRD